MSTILGCQKVDRHESKTTVNNNNRSVAKNLLKNEEGRTTMKFYLYFFSVGQSKTNFVVRISYLIDLPTTEATILQNNSLSKTVISV